jgi:hypothetical protein
MADELQQVTDHARRAILSLNPVFWGKPRIASFVWALTTEVQELEDAIFSVLNLRLVDNAGDAQLAVLGRIVGQPNTGGFDTELYRTLIKAKIRTNRSHGSLKDILETMLLLHPPGAKWFQAGWATLGLIVEDAADLVLDAVSIVLRNAKQAEEGILLYAEPAAADPPPPPAGPTVVGVTTALGTVGTIAWPAGHEAGDLALLFGDSAGTLPEPSVPTGFTRVAGAAVGVSVFAESRLTVWSRVAESSSESNVTGLGGTGKALVVVRGALTLAEALAQASADAEEQTALAPASGAAEARALALVAFSPGNIDATIAAALGGEGAEVLSEIAHVPDGFSPGTQLYVYAGELAGEEFGPISAELATPRRWTAATITLAPAPEYQEQVGLLADSADTTEPATGGWGTDLDPHDGALAYHHRRNSHL